MASDFTLEKLKDEIQLDPAGMGYKGADGIWNDPGVEPEDDPFIQTVINDRAHPTGAAPIRRQSIVVTELHAAVTQAEFNQLSPSDESYLNWLTSGRLEIDPRPNNIFTGLIDIFPASAQPNVQAVLERQGSRAEVLWGEGRTISLSDIGAAWNRLP